MTREDYIKQRNNNSPIFIYEWYLEHKKENPLSLGDFFNFFQFWPKSQEIYNVMTNYWDAHFNVLKVPNKQGHYFMYI